MVDWATNVTTANLPPSPGAPWAAGNISAAQLEELPPGQYEVPAGTYTITGSATVPADVSLLFARDAVFKPASGVRITFNELPQAGWYKIFDYSGGGTVALSQTAHTGEVPIDWWGSSSGYWDDALKWAMLAIGAKEHPDPAPFEVGRVGVICFGRGIYRFSVTGTFSQATFSGVKRGFMFRGMGPQNTLLYMECGSTEKWFYDSEDRFGRWSFYDLGFSSDNRIKGCGFRHESGDNGEEKEFRYYNCFFGIPAHTAFDLGSSTPPGLFKGFSYEGSTNADLNKWFGCRFGGFPGGLLHFNNHQSVSHAMYGCDAELTGTFATTHEHAGGDLKVYGGTLVFNTDMDAETPIETYVVDHEGSAELWPGNNTFVFNGVRFEFHDLASMVRTHEGPYGQGVSNTVFRDCDIYVDGTPRNGVYVVQNSLVTFERTNIPETLAFRAICPASYLGKVGTGGIILFHTCDVPVDLHARSFAEYGGRVIAQGCYHHLRSADLLARTAVDFDFGWENMAPFDRSVTRKLVAIKAQAETWPHNGVDEQTMLLPPRAIITGIRVLKPAGGSDTSSYQLHVGNDDQTETYGSSVLAAANVKHTIIASDLSIDCGTVLGTRTVRLWATGTATSAQVGIGYALVEYI